jgi:ribonuclease PH
MRDVTIERGVAPQAEGSCLVSFGHTRVLCTASVETSLPPWRRGQGLGWVTAEYGMLPRATGSRTRREAAAGKQSGRTQEIQRLIGRSLRAVVDMGALGENQIILDCDVIEADGGTRTASITGAFVALSEAIGWMKERSLLKGDPIRDHVAAVSCGIYRGTPVLDLDYLEDSEADTDANFVLTGSGKFVEIQGTAEAEPFSTEELAELIGLAQKGISELVVLQRAAVEAAA